jgi:hypothetical protein
VYSGILDLIILNILSLKELKFQGEFIFSLEEISGKYFWYFTGSPPVYHQCIPSLELSTSDTGVSKRSPDALN